MLTGSAKLWSAFGSAKVLAIADPILGLSFGSLMAIAGIIELVIGSICLFSKMQRLAIGLVVWLATSLAVYRLGLWLMGWHGVCGCLGNLTAALHVPPQLADYIMKAVLIYLILGSCTILFWQWRLRNKTSRPIQT